MKNLICEMKKKWKGKVLQISIFLTKPISDTRFIFKFIQAKLMDKLKEWKRWYFVDFGIFVALIILDAVIE